MMNFLTIQYAEASSYFLPLSYIITLTTLSSNTPSLLFVHNQLDAQFFSMYVYFYSLHDSGSHVPIIGRVNCINTRSGICHSV